LDQLTLIVSDLHLGAEPQLDDFYADEEFADFLRFHTAQHARLHLVIAGDWIDFLQIDPAPERRAAREDLEEIYSLRVTEAQAVHAVERTIARHPRFFRALGELLGEATQHRLTVMRGNHDIELAFPQVQARIRAELGNPAATRLLFPPGGLWVPELGLYVEHGCQFDPWNSFARLDDPFLDRKRRALEVPFGSVVVKTFWNRVEREFPYIDKIRPMADSVTAILVQRPTYLLLKFDYFVDLALCAWWENLRRVFAWRPKNRPAPPPAGDPEATSRRLARRYEVGRLTALMVLAIAIQFVFKGVEIWTMEAHLRWAKSIALLRFVAYRFLAHLGGALAAILLARLLRYVCWRAGVPERVRSVGYRLIVLGAAIVFFEAVLRVFWLPVLLAVLAYLGWDAARTLIGRPLSERNPLARRPLDPEIEAALTLLEQPEVRTVVLGHTHAPIELEVAGGKRFINSGTWVNVIDVRNVRDEPSERSTYVAVDAEGRARLMTWRGTQPARHHSERPLLLPEPEATPSGRIVDRVRAAIGGEGRPK
jgi:UDP-2,3-diacylglucosamine pyrophosphatase LpxH